VDLSDLEQWLTLRYPQSVRTAYLIVGNRPDAEDAVQEAYLRAWRFRDTLDDASSFSPWLYRILVNACNSKLRSEIPHRDRRHSADQLESVASSDDPTSRFALSRDVMNALSALPTHLRVVVVLRYYADLSEREIAAAIGRQPGTVKSRLHEARRRLAEHPAIRSHAAESTTSGEAVQ